MTAVIGTSAASEWNQWRGANRDGLDAKSPPLVSSLPDQGLKPVWVSESISSAKNGGWSSPVVAEGRVFLFAHERVQLRELEKKKYPWLAPDKRVGMTPEEYVEYERLRRNEDEERGKAYRFRELVYCLDAKTGKTVWKNEADSLYSRFPQSGSPTVLDGRVYLLGAGRHARCLNAKTGDDIWRIRLEGDFRDEHWQSSFAIVDGVAVLLAGHLFGLDIKTGSTLWQGDPKTTRGTHASPVIWKTDGRELIIVNVAGSQTICVEPKTGRELWRITSEANLSTPVVVGNRLVTYGNSRKKGLRCFEVSTTEARHLWTYHGVQDKGSSPVVVNGHVFVQGERRLACVDLETGKADWMVTLNYRQPQYSSLVAADGRVFYALEGLLCFNATPEKFQPLIDAKMDGSGLLAAEKFYRELLELDELEKQPGGLEKSQKLLQKKIGQHGPLQCASPALADGKIFIRLKNGIACYDLRDRATASLD